ncbi:hypothetical protein [Flavihumibacter petaseus]|nr:hypothetical protein [Flavihumibacter petaseus]
MKKFVLAGVVMVALAACMKTSTPPAAERIYASMSFSVVQSPDTAAVGDTVKSYVTVTGSNTCYKFEGFNGTPSAGNQYDIRAVGSIPNPDYSGYDPSACMNFPITKDTFLTITPKATGKLVFRFYNNDVLFRADTLVVVNP